MPVGSEQALQSTEIEESAKDLAHQPAPLASKKRSSPAKRSVPDPKMVTESGFRTGFSIPVLLMAAAPALWLPLLIFQFNTPSTTASQDSAPGDKGQDLVAEVPQQPSSLAKRGPLQPGGMPPVASARAPWPLDPLASKPSPQDLGEPTQPVSPIRPRRASSVATVTPSIAPKSPARRRPPLVKDSLAALPPLPRRLDPQPPKTYVPTRYEGVAEADPVVQPNRDILVDPPITLADSPREPSATPVSSQPRWEPSPSAPQDSAPLPAQSAALPGGLDSHVAPPPSW